MYSSPRRMTGLSQLYGALEYKQQEKLAKEAEEERKRELERQRRQQEKANKHSAFGANLQALGTIGGAIVGGFSGNPGGVAAGAAAGASLGSALAGGTMALAPNIGGTQPDASNPYYQPASDLQRGATALQSGLQVWSTYENQIREPWLRKAGNATNTNTYKHFQEGGDVAATQKYMTPQEGSKFSQAMIDAGYNADNLPWYITEDDVLNLQNEQYITFNETIAPIGQTAKIDILNDVAMVGETMGNVGLDHIRELTLRKTPKERMAYLDEQGVDNPHLRSIAEQPTWLINQGWAKGRELRNATLAEQRKAVEKLKEKNQIARTKEIDSRYESVMRTWDNILNNPTDMGMSGYKDLKDKKMSADVFTEIYDRKYGLSAGNRPEMYYDVLRRYDGGKARDYFSTSTNPKVQQAYQLFLSQDGAGTLFSQTGGVVQDQSSATSKKEPSELQGTVAQQADTTTSVTPDSSTSSEETSPTGKPLINESARKSLSLDQQKESEQYLETPYQSFSKTDVFGNRIGGETPEEAARKAQERMQGYTFQDKQDYIKRTGSLKGFYDQFASDQATAETKQDAPKVAAVSAEENLNNRYPIRAEGTVIPTQEQIDIAQEFPSASGGFGMSSPAPMRTENDAVMERMEKSLRQTNAVPGGGTLDPAKDADTNPVPVRRVGELETGRPVFEDQLGRRYSEMPEVVETAEGFVVAPTVDLQGKVRDITEITERVNQTLATEGAPLDDFTGEQLPYFNTEEEAETYRDQRKEDIGETVPSASTYQRIRDRAIGGVDPMDQINEQLREGRENPLPATTGQSPITYNRIGSMEVPDAPKDYTREYPPEEQALLEYARETGMDQDTLRRRLYSIRQGAPKQQVTQGQASTRQTPPNLVNRTKAAEENRIDESIARGQAGMTGVGWNEYQKRKAELIGQEEAVVQPIQERETPAEEPIQDLISKGTTQRTLGDGFYKSLFKPGEREKVIEGQELTDAREAARDAENDRRAEQKLDPRQSRASEFRKAPPTVPNRYKEEGLPVAPPEEKSLRDAIIEGFPATERDNLTGIMDQIIALESDGDETAESAAGATGILQLMPGTVKQLMGKDADASDDDTYVAAANKLFTKNSSLLERNGYSINALNMYVLHHFGAGGKKLLDADSDTLVKDVKYYNVVSKKDTPLIQQREVNANPWINSAAEINQKTWKDLTVGEFLEYLEQAVNSGDFPQPEKKVA